MPLNLTTSDSQNLVYSLLLLGFLVSSLLFRRQFKISEALKYILIWSIIILICITLYAYRFEFQSFKNRILGEINPNQAILTQDEKLIINLSSDGHFYINTKINNQPVRFMIDTGASDIVLNLETARKIGINIKDLNFNKRYNTANGAVFGASIKLNTLEISGINFHNIDASVNGSALDTPLLGMSFLRNFRRYEFYQDKLILEF